MVVGLNNVKHFIYLGATVSETGGINKDIRRRLGHARLAYNKLKSVWNNSQFGRKTKMKQHLSSDQLILYRCSADCSFSANIRLV
jgi:hypothetical protein